MCVVCVKEGHECMWYVHVEGVVGMNVWQFHVTSSPTAPKGSPFQSCMEHLRDQPCSWDTTISFVPGSGHHRGQGLCQAMTWIRYRTEAYSQALGEWKWLRAQDYDAGFTCRAHTSFWKCAFLLCEEQGHLVWL